MIKKSALAIAIGSAIAALTVFPALAETWLLNPTGYNKIKPAGNLAISYWLNLFSPITHHTAIPPALSF